ncbi:MAG: TMEM43 family protein [Bacteroidales bacterium]|nr:TMEM43 family protein [Bacteroidales bacterium]MBN2820737.1 TMEM43 family protein [Bacteroidales bacterium]
MSDTFTEVTRKSYGSRIKGAFGGILFGLILIIGGIWLLSWNEGRTIKTKRALNEGAEQVVSVDASTILPGNENLLIHISGMAETSVTLTDSKFGVSANAIHLKRDVEMYQWVEDSESKSEKKVGGAEETSTTYTYKKEWSGSLSNSSDFKKPEGHTNPSAMPYDDDMVSAADVFIGKYKLSTNLISSISGYEPLDISSLNVSNIPDAKLEGNRIFIGKGSEASPEIGDVRINFSIVSPKVVSAVGKQTASTISSFTVSNGKDISMLYVGNLTADEMFTKAKKSNKITGYLLRLLGLVLLIAGFNFIFRPIAVLSDVVPFFGRIVRAGTGFLSFILGLIIGLVTMALAWIAYRPIVAIPLLVGAAALLVWSIIRSRKKKLAVSE